MRIRFTIKYFLILFLMSLGLYGSKNVVSVIVNSEINIPDDFQSGIEEELTSYGYYLCQDNGCKNIYLQVKVDITKKSKNVYRFKAKFLDLKNKRALSIKSLYFKGSINDYEKLMKFGKDLTKLIVKNIINLKNNKTKEKEKAKADAKKAKAKQAMIDKRNLITQEKLNRLMKKQMMKDKVDSIQNQKNTDLFYNSVISHPPIINLR